MHSILDYYAHCNRLKSTPTELKVGVAVLALLSGVFAGSPLVPLTVFAAMGFLTVSRAGVPGRVYLKMFYGPVAFTLPAVAAMVFFFGKENPIFSFDILGFTLTAYGDGFDEGILVLSRVLGGSASMFFLAFTTPMVELFAVLHRLRVPSPLVNLSMMVYRFIFVVMEEASRMHFAQRARLGHSGFRRSISSFGLLASNLFIRSWDRSDRLYTSMDARCYDGDLSALGEDI